MDLASCWSWVSDDDDDKLSSFINIFIPSMTFTTCFLCTTAKPVVRSLLFSNTHRPRRQRNMSTGCIVYVGVKFVNKFATVALLCVIFSIIAVYTGIFTNIHGNDRLKWVVLRLSCHSRALCGGTLRAINKFSIKRRHRLQSLTLPLFIRHTACAYWASGCWRTSTSETAPRTSTESCGKNIAACRTTRTTETTFASRMSIARRKGTGTAIRTLRVSSNRI